MSNVDAEGGLMIATQDDVRAALLGVAADGSWALSAEDTVLIERLIVLRALIFDSNTSELAAELYTEDGNPCPPPLPALLVALAC